MLTFIPLEHLKRQIPFPFPVAAAGSVHYYCTHPEDYLYSQLEVCLRLSSDAPHAADVIDGREYRTPFPHVICKMAGHRHSFHSNDHREAVFFIYSKEITEKLAAEHLVPERLIEEITLAGRLEELVAQLNMLLMSAGSYGTADRIDLCCFAILEELLLQRGGRAESLPEKRIRHIASLIQRDPGSAEDLMRLARENGFSERSFFRHWRKVFQISPAQYRMETAMKQAAYLLSHTALSVGRIASNLHFCDDNYFSTCFRRHYGMTPREYRLRTRKM